MQSAPNGITHRLVCEHAVLPDGANDYVITEAVIDISGATIANVYLGSDDAPALDADVRCEHLRNQLVTPAFVDAHTHLALTCLRGLSPLEAADNNLVESFFYTVEAHMTAEDVRAFVRVGGLEAILSGTGIVWDHYYYPDAIVAGLRDIGLAGVVAPTLQDRGGPGTNAMARNLDYTLELSTSDTATEDGIFAALGLHASDTVSASLLRRCATAAENHRLPVHCHVAQSLAEVERTRALDGCTPGEHLVRSGILDAAPAALLVHGIFLTEQELQALAERNTTLAFCPHSKQIFAYLPDLERWLKSGLNWVVGTDCAASNDGWSIPRELRYVAGMRSLKMTWSQTHQRYLDTGELELAQRAWNERSMSRRALSALESNAYVLDRGWRAPGALHPAFTAGVISQGARACLATWDLTHPAFWPNKDPLRTLVWGRTDGALHRMMINGAWWSELDGANQAIVHSDMWKECRREASERLEKLLQRVR